MPSEFHTKSFTTRCSCVKRFMHAHSYTYRMGKHTSQRPPVEVEGEAFDFLRFVGIIVSGLCEALYACPFLHILNGQAHVAAPSSLS